MNIPPHLKVAESVTAEEYNRAKKHKKLLIISSVSVCIIGLILGAFLMSQQTDLSLSPRKRVTGMPIFSFPIIGFLATFGLGKSFLFKDASKMSLAKFKKYPDLCKFKERNKLS